MISGVCTWCAVGRDGRHDLQWLRAGHDHGEAPAAAAGTALPRFAATSDLFELVGVLDGQKIALYLDHAGDNSPVKDARLELDIAGTNVPVTRVAEGEFQATLAAPLAEGVSPVTATVAAGTDTDLLAGEIDLHPAAHTDAAPAGLARRTALIAGAVAAVLLALVAAWRLRRGRAAGHRHRCSGNGRTQPFGKPQALRGLAVVEQQHEFLAAEAGHQVARAQGPAHRLGHGHQGVVTGGMAVGVVELLEVVHVQQDQHHADAVAA